MLVEIPLTDDERAAVEGDQTAVGRLIGQLADTPTPAGPTPRDLKPTGPELSMLPAQAQQPGAADAR